MANIHAREITTPELAMRFLDLLLEDYGFDADITWLVDYHGWLTVGELPKCDARSS
jgi:hypothetical protein